MDDDAVAAGALRLVERLVRHREQPPGVNAGAGVQAGHAGTNCHDAGRGIVRVRDCGLLDGEPQAGLLVGERVYPTSALVTGLKDAASVLGLVREWDKAHPQLDSAAKNLGKEGGVALSDVTLLAPILYPGALYCAGANYWDHLEEMAEIAKTYDSVGVTPQFHLGAEWLYELVATTPYAAETRATQPKERSLDEALTVLTAALEREGRDPLTSPKGSA